VVPRRPKEHEQYAIATINPFREGFVPFANITEVLEEYLTEVARVGFVSLHSCPFGAAYVQFRNMSVIGTGLFPLVLISLVMSLYPLLDMMRALIGEGLLLIEMFGCSWLVLLWII
jgi:hypothetical protein